MKRTPLAAARALCLALVWSLASSAQRAHAAELRIDWTGPPTCSSARDLRARVAKLVGSSPPSDVVATVEVTRNPQGFRAQVVVRGPSRVGTRHLEDARCEVLVDSVAVLIALSMPTPPRLDRGRALSFALQPQLRVSSGTLPLAAAGLGGAVAIEGLDRFRLELHGAYYFPQATTFEQDTLGGDFGLFAVGAVVCRLWRFDSIQWGPCVGGEVHHIRASGFGGAIQRPGSTTWWGPLLRVLARAQLLPMFGISIAVEGVVPMSRPQFVFTDVGPLHRVGSVVLQAFAGPEVRF